MAPADAFCAEHLEYRVRVSERARRVRLTVTPKDGLVVVVPRGFRGDVGQIVESKRSWALRALERVAERRELHVGGAERLMPDVVELRATGRLHAVECVHAARSGVRETATGGLEVRGPDAESRLAALTRWLDRVARDVLPARAERLAAHHGVHPQRIRVTRARTRWGSCSSRGTVSLNRNLLFLEPTLVDALVMHELAHLRVLDHSPRFWAALSELDPDWQIHRARLRAAGTTVPAWADV